MNPQDAAAALRHRSTLDAVTFVAVTGSCGKTTTKDLATALLLPSSRGTSNPGSGNCGLDVVRQVLRVTRGDAFCIQELGAWGPETLDAGLSLVQPRVGVVLNVRRDHYTQFRGLEHTQAEKAKVVECLPASGTAILNADDERTACMRDRTAARVLTFGTSPHADFRAGNVRSTWPERLSFDLHVRGAHRVVRTRLIGEHLVGSALAALAIAHTLGVPLDAAVRRIADVEPTARRMSAVVTRSGIAVVRDDFKAVSDSLGETLHFLDRARADRKVLAIGRISDHPGRSRAIYTSFAREAAGVVDLLVFVGERPESLWGRDRRGSPDFLDEISGAKARIALFETVRDASRYLLGELRTGDLLVLKGSGASDHLERIVLVHETDVQCWRARCELVTACDACALLGSPAELESPVPDTRSAS